jgi:hypothetical protein
MPTAGASAGQVRRRRGSGRATVRAMGEPHDDAPDGDLQTLALFVYFVALIVLVAGLLVLPALY